MVRWKAVWGGASCVWAAGSATGKAGDRAWGKAAEIGATAEAESVGSAEGDESVLKVPCNPDRDASVKPAGWSWTPTAACGTTSAPEPATRTGATSAAMACQGSNPAESPTRARLSRAAMALRIMLLDVDHPWMSLVRG